MQEKIPLSAADVGEAEWRAAREVILSGWMTHGPKNHELEGMFADRLGVAAALSLNSGYSALYLALRASGVDGEVILPSFTHVASANAVAAAGATPVFADIGYDDCNICPRSIERCLSSRTQALMIVHFAGQVCDMDSIQEIVGQKNLLLIEDSAETIGGTYRNREAGSFGIGCFSFFPTKNMTTGEGGLLSADDPDLVERARALAGHGIRSSTWQRTSSTTGKPPWHREASEFGCNFRLSNILAAIGVVQMGKLDRMNESRRRSAAYLIEGLKDEERLDLPLEMPHRRHVYQMFTVKVRGAGRAGRDALVWKLRDQQVEASVHFDPPLHQQEIFAAASRDDLKVTERVAASILSLPLFPSMTTHMLDRIIASTKKVLARLKRRRP